SVKPDYKEYSFEFNIKTDARGFVIIHPFAIRKEKEWGLHKYIELAGRLNKYYNVIVISPPNFMDDDTLFEIELMQIDLQITNTIDELIQVTQKAALFISNDSGPIYIASLLGKPTFTIYGPTNPKFSLPFGAFHKYYQKILSCSASDEKYCFTLGGINCPSQECLNLISVDEIENEIISFIKELSIEKKTAK
ncbi:MAG: glycosyltransferase family 9 protein, partial [Ignavibacteria bacterium]|nr:glycosyltransferase family 9 protein [Ignavibacteria bacterium]